jgi:RimJ/RimL family protein N-acetyltransferase
MPKIRRATLNDLELLSRLSAETFIETFGKNYSEEDLNEYLTQRLSKKAIEGELKDPENIFFLIENLPQAPIENAEVEDCEQYSSGYIKITPNSDKFLNDLSDKFEKPLRSCYLERFYLLKDSQGSGLAHLAMQELITWVNANTQCDTIHLTVFVENHRAQKFYQKYGFIYAGDTIYHVGNTKDHELIYLKALAISLVG